MDEGLLAQALKHTPSIDELTTPYTWEGVTVFFRESELSNSISFAYGNKPTDVAVEAFLDDLGAVWQQLDDPSQRALTLAMDGENWMFLAGYPNNGRTFLRALYAALSEANWITTVTPAELLADGLASVPLTSLPTGSWAGDLSTWSGEPDEDEGWARLAAARSVVSDAGDPADAVEAIYAAEGSDWFWWYGTDQDSNTDDLYDWLFKAHLIGAHRAVSTPEEDIPGVLSLRLRLPYPISLGEVTAMIDGLATDDEDWTSAAAVSGSGLISSVDIGYSEGLLFVRVHTDGPASALIGTDQFLMLYATGAAGDAANVSTRYAGVQLGHPLARVVQLDLAKVRDDGRGTVAVYVADGTEGWSSGSTLQTLARRRAQVDDVIEYAVPFDELGIEPGKSVTITLVLESQAGTFGRTLDRPVLAAIPTLIQGTEIFSWTDPVGDDTGTGTYAYPTAPDFDDEGLFDIVRYALYDAEDRWQFAIEFETLTNTWNGPQGFSHPIVFLYLDVADGGATKTHEEGKAARIEMSANHPWDVFLKIAGWPSYGRHMWTASGEGPFLIEVASDPKKGRIIVTVPKELVPEIAGWHYVAVASQDGYGANHVRPVVAMAGIWTGGGSPDTTWAPQVYDVLTPPGQEQTTILASYESGTHYAILLPIEVQP